jgi:ubiquinone/menaquinone biosynthesis C-methylase UbiE
MKGRFDNYWSQLGKMWAIQNLKREYSENRQNRRKDTAEKIANLVKNIKHPKILEIGCNYGANLDHLSNINNGKFYGIDISKDGIEKGKELLGNKAILSVGTLFDLPYEDNYFDVVFTVGVLIHIHPDELESALKEISRVSKNWVINVELCSKIGKPKKQNIMSNKDYKDNKFQYLFEHDFNKNMYKGLSLIDECNMSEGNLVYFSFKK